MALAQSTSDSAEQPNAASILFPTNPSGSLRVTVSNLLGYVIFGFLVLFAVTLPHSVKGAERSWKIALVLWLVKLAIDRKRPYRQPLAAPLLAYVLLSTISTLLSQEPLLSWDRMKFVCLYLAGIVVAQTVQHLWQVRWLAILLVVSGCAAGLYTGLQYTYGVGVWVDEMPPGTHLMDMGLRLHDTITAVDGHRVHTPEELIHVVSGLPPSKAVAVRYVRFQELRPSVLTATASDFVKAGLGTGSMRLQRGKPYRAQGTLGHYVVFAEMLMQVGCLAWALLLLPGREKLVWRIACAASFVSIALALLMTETRADVAGLVMGCLIILFLVSQGLGRWAAVVGLVVMLAGATVWIQRHRGVQWVDQNDISTHFRVLMWQDGVRLVRQHPWFGVGMETVRVHWQEWNIRGFIQYHVRSHFHSTYLQIAVERGVPALLAWLWFCVGYVVFLLRLIQRLHAGPPFARSIAIGVLGALVAFLFTSFFHYNLGEESIAMLLFFYYGLAVATDRITATAG